MILQTIAILFSLAGLFLLGLAVIRAWRGRLLSSCGQACGGLVLVLAGFLLSAIALNLHTYYRLTAEREVAVLHFEQLAPGHYTANLLLPDGDRQQYTLTGEQWQLDARVLKWHGPAVILGFDTAYRLERLSGRYASINDYTRGSPPVYALYEDSGMDLWRLAQRHPRWLPGMDTIYGSATYMPMADGARYTVSVSASGLVTRPANEEARRAIERW